MSTVRAKRIRHSIIMYVLYGLILTLAIMMIRTGDIGAWAFVIISTVGICGRIRRDWREFR